MGFGGLIALGAEGGPTFYTGPLLQLFTLAPYCTFLHWPPIATFYTGPLLQLVSRLSGVLSSYTDEQQYSTLGQTHQRLEDEVMDLAK